jgi:hypothetical protein
MFFVLWIGLFTTTYSQQTVKFLADSSSLQIKGTSNLHDWEEKVQKFNVDLTLGYKEKEIIGIDKVVFSCNSASVVSDNSIMTGKTHDALKTDKYPDIKFTLSEVVSFQNNNGKISGSMTGDLFLAGVIKKVNLPFTGNKTSNALILKGSTKISMTDFKIDPPTAILGTLKTGEAVELDYSLKFKTD